MRIRRASLAAIVGAAAVLGSMSPAATADAGQQTPASTAELVQLQTILLNQAALHGDPTPTRTLGVAASSHAAEGLMSGGSHDGQAPVPAYLLCAKGKFAAAGGSVPPGVRPAAKRPTTLCLVVVAQGLGVAGLRLGSHYPELRRLGTVQDLNVQPVLTATELAQLRTVLLAQAQGTGDPHPTRLRMVAATYGAALSVLTPGQGVDGDTTPVFVLVASGHFRSPFELPATPGRPRPARPVVGTLWVIVPQTGAGVLTDGGSVNAPDLGKLGRAQPL
jgi:hypothetical protein